MVTTSRDHIHFARLGRLDEKHWEVQQAVKKATKTMITLLGAVILIQSPEDKRHWSCFLLDGRYTGKFFATQGDIYTVSVGFPTVKDEERPEARASLLALFEYLKAADDTPIELFNELEKSEHSLRAMLNPVK